MSPDSSKEESADQGTADALVPKQTAEDQMQILTSNLVGQCESCFSEGGSSCKFNLLHFHSSVLYVCTYTCVEMCIYKYVCIQFHLFFVMVFLCFFPGG